MATHIILEEELVNSFSKILLLSCLAVVFFPAGASAQDADHEKMVKNALSAATAAIASGAAVMDGDGNVLREGTNSYTCLPDDPDMPGNSPMCLDGPWLAWAHAWMSGEEAPAVETIAFGYMLQSGNPGSNIDPNATEPTDDNEWIETGGPHIMLLAPLSVLEGMSHDPNTGEPWVMWRGTSLAHVMVPTAQRK